MKRNNQQDESEKVKRQKLSQEEVKKRNQEYEQTKRKRLFKDVWKQNRPWLRIERKDDGKEVMFCDYCIPISSSAHHERNVQKNAFIYGCSNIRLETIKIHESTNTHLYAVNRKKTSVTQRMLQHIELNRVSIRQSMQSCLSCSVLYMPSIFMHDLPLTLFG